MLPGTYWVKCPKDVNFNNTVDTVFHTLVCIDFVLVLLEIENKTLTSSTFLIFLVLLSVVSFFICFHVFWNLVIECIYF